MGAIAECTRGDAVHSCRCIAFANCRYSPMKQFTYFALVGLFATLVHYTVALSTSQVSNVFFGREDK